MTKLILITRLLNIKINVADVTIFSEQFDDFWVVLEVEKPLILNETLKIFGNCQSIS